MNKIDKPIAVTVQAAARLTSLSKTTIYALIKEGALRTTLVRSRRLIFYEDIVALLEDRIDESTVDV